MKYTVHETEKFTMWYKEGTSILHREGGPAIEDANGIKKWYLNGQLHREGGPAIEDASGSKHWYINGLRHREDGPACEYVDGTKMWYQNGISYSQEEFLKLTQTKTESCDGKLVEIDGKKYKLTEVK